jgi:bifunctional non-homologous end joining protein LigD
MVTPAAEGSAAPADPRAWRPQAARPTRRPTEIADAIVEPLWRGRRVMAHFRVETGPDGGDRGVVELIDEAGADVADDVPRVAANLRDAVMALEAVIDGILTDQATAGGVGRTFKPRIEIPRPSLITPRRMQEYSRPPRQRDEAPLGEISFVALDLLSIDGQSLLDVPLLERRRQLESLFLESEFLRVTPYARPPIGPWFNSWRSAGFSGLIMKAVNSRYRPGELTSDWTILERMPRR